MEKRYKEIQEMTKAYASHMTSDKDMQVAFADALRRGAEWADAHPHWISVKDRKPKLKHLSDNLKYSDSVIVTNGEYRTAACWVYNTWGGWYGWYDAGDEELKGITHWMPLPQAPKEGD